MSERNLNVAFEYKRGNLIIKKIGVEVIKAWLRSNRYISVVI
jgi:hypothetical protein